MSFFGFGKRKSSTSRDPLEEEKERQIKLLKQTFPSLRRPNNNDSLFEIRFQVDSQYMALKIFVPADFPNTRPVLQVSGPLMHSWLDSFKRVIGCPKLNAWTSHSSMLEVVEDTLAALSVGSTDQRQPSYGQQQPPQQQQQQQQALPPYLLQGAAHMNIQNVPPQQYNTGPAYYGQQQQPYLAAVSSGEISYGNSYANTTPQQQQQQQPPQHPQSQSQSQSSFGSQGPGGSSAAGANLTAQFGRSGSLSPPRMRSVPDCVLPGSFPELSKMSTIQLRRLAQDSVAIDALLENAAKQDDKVASLQEMRELRDAMRRSNVEAAMENTAMAEALQEQSRKVEVARAELRASRAAYTDKLARVKGKFTVARDTVEKQLKDEMDKLDIESEKLGEQVIKGEIEVSEFLQKYTSMREKYHGTAVKLTSCRK